MKGIVIFVAIAAILVGVSAFEYDWHSGIPLSHKWRQSSLCREYARKSGDSFSPVPLAEDTFYSERLGTCIQAHTFAGNDYSIIDLTHGYSENTWLFICGEQGLYETSFAEAKGYGVWKEEGRRLGRPCEKLFKKTISEIQ
jgi:hypothetical protein